MPRWKKEQYMGASGKCSMSDEYYIDYYGVWCSLDDYYVDENLKKKVSSIFEEPDETEVDVIIWIVE